MMLHTLRSLTRIVRSPVPPDTRRRLTDMWAELPESLRAPQQLLGRHVSAVRPRVDGVPVWGPPGWCGSDGEVAGTPRGIDEMKEQMRRLRPRLGAGGAVRFAPGESMSSAADDVIDVLGYAQSLGLTATIVTDGDAFRRRPGLLERYMWEGGLAGIDIQVDSTGGPPPGDTRGSVAGEAALDPLRDHFAAMVRIARERTGLRLHAATTMAITEENADAVPHVIRWLIRNADAFSTISFHPRDAAAAGVSAARLWAKIAEGLYGANEPAERILRGQFWIGDPTCGLFVRGVVARRGGADALFHPLRDDADRTDRRVVDGFLQRFGGVSFRGDNAPEACARVVGLALHAPGFVVANMARYSWHWLHRIDPAHPLRAARHIVRRRLTLQPLTIATHDFATHDEVIARRKPPAIAATPPPEGDAVGVRGWPADIGDATIAVEWPMGSECDPDREPTNDRAVQREREPERLDA